MIVEPLKESFFARLSSYMQPSQVEKVKKAFNFATKAHEGQVRASGEPYISHPLAVANIIADLYLDHTTLMAAMLHDVIEDCGVSKETLSRRFGTTTASLVDGVSKLNKIEYRGSSSEERQAENFQKMILATANNNGIILIKLADRLHNMRTLSFMPRDKQCRIASETLEIYAPIAQRLGMNNMGVELENLGFKYLHPMRFQRLEAAFQKSKGNRNSLVLEIQAILESCIHKEGIKAQVKGREKYLYSIYKKMKDRKVSFKEMMDVFAFRVIVDTVDECYRTLGIIHGRYKPKMFLIKDYIALPKVNNYQSLHTTVMVPLDKKLMPMEIQIRTEDMDTTANQGLAAPNEGYKKGDKASVKIASHASEWAADLREMSKHSGDAMEFLEHVKNDIFPSGVYVFSPKNEIRELPLGATPIDFAYSVHTDIGNHCISCRINDRMAPLSEPLNSSDVVEICIDNQSKPSPAWLNFVVTSKARSAIRHYLKQYRTQDTIKLGKQMLSKVLIDADIKLDFAKVSDAEIAEKVGYNSMDGLLEQIGRGNTSVYAVAKLLVGDNQENLDKLASQTGLPITIDGSKTQAISYALCCFPLPGDPIYSHFTAARGMVIHRHDCKNIKRDFNRPAICMPASWSEHPDAEFHAEIRVRVKMFSSVMGALANRASASKAGVDKVDLEESGSNMEIGSIKLLLLVKDRVHLANVMRRIRILPYVLGVKRSKG